MSSIKSLATFFGWCTIINIGLLIFAALAWMVVNDGASQIGASMMGISAEQVRVGFFDGLMIYRAGIFLFNLVPYVALKIMGRGQVGASPYP